MTKIILFLLFVISTVTWMGCETAPIYDDTPNISWGGFTNDTIQQNLGTTKFRIDFTDGDGDLGKTGDTAQHIIIIDTRRTPNDTSFFQIPTISPSGASSGISGTLEVDFANVCCVNPQMPLILCQPIANTYQPVIYKIRIKDNAGRWSNEIETTPLHLKCF